MFIGPGDKCSAYIKIELKPRFRYEGEFFKKIQSEYQKNQDKYTDINIQQDLEVRWPRYLSKASR